jgi:hypothetical protein
MPSALAPKSDSGIAEEAVEDLAGGEPGGAGIDQHAVLALVDVGAEAPWPPGASVDDVLMHPLANELVRGWGWHGGCGASTRRRSIRCLWH